MHSSRVVHVVSCHAEGEVGDVIVGGVAPPPGKTLWQQSRFLARDGALRAFVLNEPRGGVFRHVNLLVPPRHPRADMGFIIMEPEDTPPMSGSNSICVATVLLETGILPMSTPETRLVLEAPRGLVEATADCREGRVERVRVRNVASFADRLGVPLEVVGLGTLTVDTTYGGDSFVLVDPAAAGLALHTDNARILAETGSRIISAASEQVGFSHPENPDWEHISFYQFTAPLTDEDGVALGDAFIAESIIGSRFHCRLEEETTVGGHPAIVPSIAGRAWITGTHQHTLDPRDPWPGGYRLSDTWPQPGDAL